MDETNFIDKKALKHFEKQLALRDKYVKENGDYIEKKRDRIGLSSSEILAELCFALNMENEIDDDGDNWNIAYMYNKIYYDFFNPSKNHEGTLKELGILADLAENPKVMERLNISLDDIQDYYNATLHFIVTAPFPEEDTGYIEEGFDYCIDVGANLVASPCRDEIDIIDTLPSQIRNNLTSIVGQGVAANNQNGEWHGSLNGLGGGDGYWFISNASACFNYNCAEN